MDITLQNHTYPLTKSCLDVDSLKQLLDDFCREETEIRHFESDELCIICLRKPASVPLKYCRNDYDRGRLLFARQYLLDHITRPPSIEDLARIAGINSFKLKNGFKELFQETVYGYLNKYRLEKAKQLILCEEKNMTQISFELGFSSLQHFSTAFKKAYGCSPKKIKTVVQHTDLL
jgi:AraC-like DNA-binding protein